MDFSVIVPAYNREHLIGATLEAIFDQTLPPTEVIVVDDGSTDGSATVAANRAGCRVIRSANAGAAHARHIGVLASSCPRLAFCDSDDVWRPNHLAALSAAFDLVPGAGFAFSNFVHITNDTWSSHTKFDQAPTGFWHEFSPISSSVMAAAGPVFKDILRFQPIFPSCTAMSRSFYDMVGGYNSAFGRLPSEDLEFTLRCVSHAPVVAVREATVGIRRHAGNHSGNQMKQLCGEVEILTHAKTDFGISPDWAAAVDAQIVLRAGQAIDCAFANGRWDLVRAMCAYLPWRLRSPKRIVKITLAYALYGTTMSVLGRSLRAGRREE